MKVIAVCLVILSFASLSQGSVASLFSSWKSGNASEKQTEGKSTSTGRKVVLVPKTVYVPVYTSDGEEPTMPLAPISSISSALPVGPAIDQLVGFDFRQKQPEQPLPESYAIYGPGSAASFAYGAVGPQFQYAAAVPVYDTVPQYVQDQAAPDAPYPPPTGIETAAIPADEGAPAVQTANADTAPEPDGSSAATSE